MILLYSSVGRVNKIGLAMGKKLKKLGIDTVEDLLYHFPFRYDDFATATNLEKIPVGENVNIVGFVDLIQNRRSPHKKMSLTEAIISNGSGQVKAIWFNQPFIIRNLKTGDQISLSGRLEDSFSGPVIKSPVYEKISGGQTTHTQGIIPNYALTTSITQKQIRFLIKCALQQIGEIEDFLPKEIIADYNLPSLHDAINKIHFPESKLDVEQAKYRLAFDELFLVQLESQITKIETGGSLALPIKFLEDETRNYVNSLPFKLTDAQKKSSWEILQDLAKDKPMTRMLEGDVGSGKTVVASMAILNAAKQNIQSVLMVPTEILATQHFRGLRRLFAETGIRVGIMTRNERKIDDEEENLSKKKMIEKIASGEVDTVVGTHALIQDDVIFSKLGLSIIDEQHRFGVEQRKNLTQKSGQAGITPHLLSMTATPIPRSLALVLYGDLDVSIINQLPAGRKPILTQIVPEEKREKMYQFLREKINEGRQVFVVCPLIDISDRMGVKSVEEEYQKLKGQIFPDLQIEMLHGKLRSAEKEEIMGRFTRNEINILVSTSVIEVGVDVPNASIMLIEGADRFGLAQLHQFRGRVGRGEHQSYCFLASDNSNSKTKQRLDALVKTQDGFLLAQTDLKMRGPGEVYGTSQKGFPEFKVATLFDQKLIKNSNEAAIKITQKSSNLEIYPELKQKIREKQRIAHME